jgi:hypothetical protein
MGVAKILVEKVKAIMEAAGEKESKKEGKGKGKAKDVESMDEEDEVGESKKKKKKKSKGGAESMDEEDEEKDEDGEDGEDGEDSEGEGRLSIKELVERRKKQERAEREGISTDVCLFLLPARRSRFLFSLLLCPRI